MQAVKTSAIISSIGLCVAGIGAPCDRVEADFRHFDSVVAAKKLRFEEILPAPQDKNWVRAKLAHMVDVDRYLRVEPMNWLEKYNATERDCFWKGIRIRSQAIDSANTKDLASLMALYRWFTISEFGAEASDNAWLLAQHADHDRPFQRRVLGILEELHPKGDVDPRNYAYLYDRVTWYADNKPQRYATQGRCVAPGDWQPWNTEDFANVDVRRAALGMEPWKEYKRRVDAYCQ